MDQEPYLAVDFALPNHATELSKAEDIIEKLKTRVKKIQETKSINDKKHTDLYEETVRVLDYIGRLSIPAFEIEEQLERLYVLHYPKSPALSKKLFWDHYENVHHPYSILKSRCFRVLEELDKEYRKRFKKNPPNWKI
jgi:hypothetical protein